MSKPRGRAAARPFKPGGQPPNLCPFLQGRPGRCPQQRSLRCQVRVSVEALRSCGEFFRARTAATMPCVRRPPGPPYWAAALSEA